MIKPNIRKTYLGSQAIDKKGKVNKVVLEKIVNMDPIAILQYTPNKHQITEKYLVIKKPADLEVSYNQVSADQLKMWLDTIPNRCIIYERKHRENIFEIYKI